MHGGAGAVGNAAIQLATWSGATVLTTVSSAEKAALATAAGAHHVVNYRAEDAVAAIRGLAPDGVDLIAEGRGRQGADRHRLRQSGHPRRVTAGAGPRLGTIALWPTTKSSPSASGA